MTEYAGGAAKRVSTTIKTTTACTVALLSLVLLLATGATPIEATILGTEAIESLACRMCGVQVFGLLCCIRRSQCCNFSGRTLGTVEDTVSDVGKKLGILPLPFRRR